MSTFVIKLIINYAADQPELGKPPLFLIQSNNSCEVIEVFKDSTCPEVEIPENALLPILIVLLSSCKFHEILFKLEQE
ncbi:MAG: hypothetical protein K2L48_04670 [Mycoplasmoidaceae bacterium]|nr:hypothetical protein [Mycoplasmoidaceae bacterium]